MKAKKHDEKGAEDWYNQLDDSVDVFEVRNQALIELEEASCIRRRQEGRQGCRIDQGERQARGEGERQGD